MEELEPRIGQLREAARRTLSEERYAHTLRVEAEAMRLADCHGLSASEKTVLRAAALLHDITKELSLEDHLKLCRKWDILIDCETISCPAVLHQFTGAETAAREYALPEEVCRAIRAHTTGSAQMNTVDCILYLADLVEPGRKIAADPHICRVRKLAEQDLGEACLVQMRYEIDRLHRLGRSVHPLTELARKGLECEHNSP